MVASSYDRLHSEVRRWIRDEGWTELRAVQDRSIRAILDSKSDILISATTAVGKTEAAFLPLLGTAAERTGPGLSILYVSPLKALINDQARRLGGLCDRMELPLVKWHGDAPAGPKARTLKQPCGIVLITPESIEAMLLRRPDAAHRLFATLDAIIIDELHAFLQGPRGLHLSSLLQRIDALSNRRARRVGLSATIGDPELAARWLCREAPGTVVQVSVDGGQPELRLQVRGYVEPPEHAKGEEFGGEEPADALGHIADHIYQHLRGTNNLVFAGSRRNVEALADRLRRRSEADRVPNEFLPHHGSLSRELREELEARLKDGTVPTTAVATTTLELGIDIGSVGSVAQLGAPRSLAGLRQRLGRSGRRAGSPAVLRIYVREKHPAVDSDPLDRLRLSTVRATAAVRLLLAHFIEPPTALDPSLASVVLHQTLSLIVERGAMPAKALHRALCATGPLAMAAGDFALLLKAMAAPETALIEQASDGLIMLGVGGERLTSARDFYANFATDDEWRLVASGRPLGTIPLSNAIAIGSLIGFAGQRWRVTAVDDRAKVVEVSRHPAGRLPLFDGATGEPLHDRLAAEMRTVLAEQDEPAYLDRAAKELLHEGREAYLNLELDRHLLVDAGRDTHLLTWRGSAVNAVVAILLLSAGLECEAHDVGVTMSNCTGADVAGVLRSLTRCPPIEDLADFVVTLRTAKFDDYVPDLLLRKLWIVRHGRSVAEVDKILDRLRAAP